MAEEIDLGTFSTGNTEWLPPEPKQAGVGDYGRAAAAGGYGLIGSIGAGVDYLTGAEPDGGAHRLRKWAEEGQKYQVEQMAPSARDALNAGFLPGGQKSIWDEDVSMLNALGLKLANASPSLLTSILPGGLIANAGRGVLTAAEAAGAGMATAGAINGLAMSGQVFDDIQRGILDAKEDDLAAGSPLYKYLRDTGFADNVARKVLVDAAAGNKPAVAGLVGMAAEHFGAGAIAARAGAGLAERGVVAGARKGFTEEAGTEAAQNLVQEGLTQQGQIEGGQRNEFDVRALVEQTVQGAAVGGLLGGAVGGVTGGLVQESGSERRPQQDAAVDPVTAGAADTATPQVLGTPRDRARQRLADLDTAIDTARNAVDEAKAPQTSTPEITAEEQVIAGTEPAVAERAPEVRVPEPVAEPVQEPSQFVPQDEYEVDPDEDATTDENGLPPVPEGHVRMFHGGSMPGEGETRWTNPDIEYARRYRASERDNDVFYADVPADHPALQKVIPDEDLAFANQPQRYLNSELPADIAAGMRRVPRQDAPQITQDAPGQASTGPEVGQAPAATDPSPEPPEAISGGSEEIDLGTVDAAPPAPTQEFTNEAQEKLGGAEPNRPRVLASTAPAPKTPQNRNGPRMSQAEAKRIASGEGDAVTLSHDPGDWKKAGDRRAVARLVTAYEEQAAAGKPMPTWAQTMVEVRGKTAGNNPTARANQARYAEARQALSDATLEKQNAGVARRETKDEARDRRLKEKRVGDAQKIKAILDEVPLNANAAKGSLAAIKEHARLVADVAKRFKIEAPVGTQDPYLIYLREASEIANGSPSRERAVEFVANDFFIRNNAGQELVDRRRSQAVRGGGRPSDEVGTYTEDAAPDQGAMEGVGTYTEDAAPDQGAMEGVDSNEAYDKEVVDRDSDRLDEALRAEQDVTPDEDVEDDASGADGASAVEPTAPDADLGAASVADTQGVVGANRAGTFKVEPRQRRVVARRATDPNPTDAQKAAGNYAKRQVKVMGLDISVENERGSTRSGKDKSGKAWSVQMPAHYGYVKRTKGVDGDHVDVYLGPKPASLLRDSDEVFVVNQQNLDGSFDEHKAMIGFRNETEAVAAYKKAFSDRKGGQRIQSVARMTQPEFKAWLASDIKGPAQDVQQRASSRPAARDAEGFDDFKPREGEKFSEYEKRHGGGREAAWAEFNNYKVAETQEKLKQDRLKREQQRERDISDLDAAFGVDTGPSHIEGDGRYVTSPRTGATIKSVSTRNLGDLLKNTRLDTAGGSSNIIAPFAAQKLRKMVADVPVHFVRKSDLARITADWTGRAGQPREVLGYYEPSTREILISADFVEQQGDTAMAHLLIHEGMHAATLEVLNTDRDAREIVKHAMQQVRDHLEDRAKRYYGMTNEHEFISELFSSRSFQSMLAGIPATENYRGLVYGNLWKSMLASIRKWLGLEGTSDTMLDASLRVGAAILDQAHDRMAPASGRMPVQPAPITQQALRDGLENTVDLRRATVGHVRRFITRASTLEDLRQRYSDLFPAPGGQSHLGRVVEAIQRMRPMVEAEKEAGYKFAEEFQKLIRKSPQVAEESAALRNDVTLANLNLLVGKPTEAQMQAANKHVYGEDPKTSDKSSAWQAKSVHGDLQKRFSALPEDVQRQMVKEAAYYKSMQNRISQKLVSNIVDFYMPDAAPSVRSDLERKALAGTLTDEDTEGLNKVFVAALKGARALKSIGGMYFPLMRHGDYVVVTSNSIGDTQGGREVRPGVVEFRAGSDKVARRAAKRFAETTDLEYMRTVKRYYGADGKTLKAVDRADAATIAYEVTVQREGFHTFDTRTEAERFVRVHRKAGTYENLSDVQVKQGRETAGDITGSQLSALGASIDKMDHVSDTHRKMLKTAIGQAAVRSMSGNRLQKRALPRRKVEGESRQYARNAAHYAESAANYLAKLEYMPAIRADLAAMDAQTTGEKRFSDKDGVRQLLLDEIRSRVDNNEVGISEPNKVVRDLMHVTMLSKLFSPMHSIINAMQPAMVTYPVLAGEHGATNTVLELQRAYRDTGALAAFGGGARNTVTAARRLMDVTLDTKDILGSIRRRLNKSQDGAALGRVLEELASRGALDDKAQFEMAAAVSAGRGAGGIFLAKLDRAFRQAPAAVEAVNRSVTAVAAFRLAKLSGKTEAQAIQYAFDTVMRTQFDYSPANASPYFNNPIARPFLQFKKYGQAMTMLYGRMVYDAAKGATPAQRRVAQKQFLNLLGVQMLMAGALGLPALELLKYGFIVSAALGLSDGWEAQERKLKKLADAAVGETWSSMVRKGLLSRAVGVDLSSRTSLADLWTFGEPDRYTGSGVLAWVGEQYFGATGGTLSGYVDGMRAVGEGDYLKAAEKWFPIKAGADIAKAAGKLAKGEAGPGTAAVNAIGARTGQQADYQERRSIRFAEDRSAKDRRNSLRKRYIEAGNAGTRLKVRAEINAYNRTADRRYKLSIPSMDRMREEDRKERTR